MSKNTLSPKTPPVTQDTERQDPAGPAARKWAQLSLFEHVRDVYRDGGKIDNDELYRRVAARAGLSREDAARVIPIGKAKAMRSPIARQIRWHQQTLKHLGLLERTAGERGVWQLTDEGRRQLRRINTGYRMLAFSTDLGIAVWGLAEEVMARLDMPVTLALTSPPYPLRRPRNYGNPAAQDYIDFICRTIEPIARNLKTGGSIALNVSNDIFQPGSPARSLYCERLVLALCERFDLHLMDRLVWQNSSKAPAPVQWASIRRMQLNVAYEPIYWFTNDPLRVCADNRRVLEPHSERQRKLIARGGEQRNASYSDGAYRLRPGDFRGETAGRIPRNILEFSHTCREQAAQRAANRELGLPPHGAPMPYSLARFLVEFLSEPGDLVVDPYGGALTTAKAAEATGRRWVTSEAIWEYLRGAGERFRGSPGFHFEEDFLAV